MATINQSSDAHVAMQCDALVAGSSREVERKVGREDEASGMSSGSLKSTVSAMFEAR
jgi:hypothetical protein